MDQFRESFGSASQSFCSRHQPASIALWVFRQIACDPGGSAARCSTSSESQHCRDVVFSAVDWNREGIDHEAKTDRGSMALAVGDSGELTKFE